MCAGVRGELVGGFGELFALLVCVFAAVDSCAVPLLGGFVYPLRKTLSQGIDLCRPGL